MQNDCLDSNIIRANYLIGVDGSIVNISSCWIETAEILGDLTVDGDLHVKGDLVLDGHVVFNGQVDFNAAVNFNDGADVKINTVGSSTTNVTNKQYVDGRAPILTVGQVLGCSGTGTTNGPLAQAADDSILVENSSNTPTGLGWKTLTNVALSLPITRTQFYYGNTGVLATQVLFTMVSLGNLRFGIVNNNTNANTLSAGVYQSRDQTDSPNYAVIPFISNSADRPVGGHASCLINWQDNAKWVGALAVVETTGRLWIGPIGTYEDAYVTSKQFTGGTSNCGTNDLFHWTWNVAAV